jgi:histidinol-phosphatase (PHP family)
MTTTVDLFTDGHVHTSLCHHATGTMEAYVRAAVEKGLQRLVFLEHLEVGINYFENTWLNEVDFALYFKEGKRLKEMYAGVIDIGMGVEVGYNPQALVGVAGFLGKYKWDRIGLSYHYFADNGRHINMLSRKKTNLDDFSRIGVAKVISSYFAGLISAVEQVPAQVLCHLDAVLRFHPDVCFDSNHEQQINLLLDMVARKNMALEINTSGFDYRGTPYPQAWIVQKAIEKNIALCLGSDAHHPKDVGRYFERIPDFFKALQ